MPLIQDVCGSQSLHGSSTAALWARPVNSDNSIIRVWAVITPPDFDPAPGLPILDLPSVELRDADHDGIYEGSYDQFAGRGTCKISIYATDTQDVFSLPALTEVIQVCPKGDISGDGEIGLADAILALKAVAGDDVRPGLLAIRLRCERRRQIRCLCASPCCRACRRKGGYGEGKIKLQTSVLDIIMTPETDP